MRNYKQFYTAFGIRKAQQLLTPPLPMLDKLQLPRQSIVHYVGSSVTEDGPKVDYALFLNNPKPIRIKHIFELVEKEGNPRRVPLPITELIRDFRTNNPRFRNYVDLTTALKEPDSITVINYAFLPRLYKYTRHRMTPWNKLKNQFATMLYEIKENDGKGFNQFLEVGIPDNIPKSSVLTTAENRVNPAIFVTFATAQLFTLLEIWMWLGPNRDESMIHRIFPEGFKDLNLIIRESNRFCVLSMAQLQEWRKASSKEMSVNALANRKGTDPQATQRRFLRLLMSIAELRVTDLPENIGGEDGDPEAVSTNNNIDVDGVVIDGSTELVAGTKEDDVFQEAITKDLDVLEEFGVEINDMDKVDDPDGINEDAAPTILDQDQLDQETIKPYPSTPKEAFLRKCADLADKGDISASEYRRAVENVTNGVQATVEGVPLEEYATIDPEDLKFKDIQVAPDIDVIVDKSMLKSTVNSFGSQYVEKVMQKDIAGMVQNVMGAGIQVTNYDVKLVETSGGSYYEYAVQLKPLQGKSSTIRFKIPQINDEGQYFVNGIGYCVRSQKSDLPIRKIKSTRVALTSYYGRVFVDRSEKRVNDWSKWLVNRVYAIGTDQHNGLISEMITGNRFDNDSHYPRLYTALSKSFQEFKISLADLGKFSLAFYPKDPIAKLGLKEGETLDRGDKIIMGRGENGEYLLIDKKSNLYIETDNGLLGISPFETYVGLDPIRAPVEFATCGVMGQDIPVGVVLGYLIGFNNLCKLLNVTYKSIPVGKRLNLSSDEWAMAFEDQSLIFNRQDQLAGMVLAGFREYHKTLALFPLSEFDHQDVYLNLLEEKKIGVRYIREMTLLENLFVDPITRELLVGMNEPLVFRELLIRSCELLLTDYHPHEQDANFMRIKGYERMSGLLYSELVKSIRNHNSMPGKSRYGVEMNPYAVWIGIQEDSAKDQVSDINPIQDLKQKEALTFSGDGGRTSRTMVARTRVYHKSDMGVTSESTVDSSDVAVNSFMSANPKFNSLRGTSDRWTMEQDGLTSLLSTSAMASIGSIRDDPKRLNFIGIQNRHVVGCEAYQQPIVRTGYEYVIPHRVGKLFAYTAKDEGVVISSDEHGIVVEYTDGKRVGVQLGRIYGSAAGLTIPHTVRSPLKTGDKFSKFDPIAYNTNFFEPDVLDPKRIIWKTAMIVNTVLMESPDTLEDSASISKKLSDKLKTKKSDIKNIVINFDQEVHRMVKEGDPVENDTALCLIEDALSAMSNMLDSDTISTLRELDSQAPRAKVKGIVERIEIYYNGEIEEMSDSLQSLTKASDKRMKNRASSSDNKFTNGQVGEEFRIGNDPLLLDTVCIRIYITSDVGTGIGDKGVFSNQLKTVFGNVFDTIQSEYGEDIDAIFGQASETNRIVSSAAIVGSTNTLETVAVQRVVKAYEG